MKRLSNQIIRTALILAAVLCLASPSVSAPREAKEIALSADELKALDRFEEHTLAKADQTFGKKLYRQARAEYDSFIVEFPRSKLIPYALLRKGRSSQFDEKRFKAIADYKEILDYFPNNVKYAAAALYHIGECHELNGDTAKAIKAWAKLAEDKGYRKQPLGAAAINYLADYLTKNEKAAEAVKYYRQVAVDFRKDNPEASRNAMEGAIRYYVRTSPGEPEYRKFYTDMGRFGHRPVTVSGDLAAEKEYWNTLRAYIRHHGGFTKDEDGASKSKTYYAYWASQMQGKFVSDLEYGDGFHIERASFGLTASGSQSEWFKLLDQQYDRLQKLADWQRTVRWMHLYAGHPKEVEQYFRKLNLAKLGKDGTSGVMKALWATPDTKPLARQMIDKVPFADMSNDELAAMALHFYEKDQVLTARFISKIDFAKMSTANIASLAQQFSHRDKLIGRSVLGKTRWSEVDDQEIARVARLFWRYDGELVKQTCLRTKDKMYGKSELLRYYESRWGWKPTEGLPLADQLIKVEKYATAAWWAKAEFHKALKQHAKAITAYQNCQNVPTNLWRISECQMNLKKVESAVTQVREIENFFPSEASKAAFHIAHLYRKASVKKKYIQALRNVLKKYPKSGESKQAHLELEKEGVKIGGGIDAE